MATIASGSSLTVEIPINQYCSVRTSGIAIIDVIRGGTVTEEISLSGGNDTYIFPASSNLRTINITANSGQVDYYFNTGSQNSAIQISSTAFSSSATLDTSAFYNVDGTLKYHNGLAWVDVSSETPLQNALKLPKWRLALAKTKQNLTSYDGAKLLLLGHSHIVGSGASNSTGYNGNGRLKNLASALSRMFNQALNPSNANGVIGFGNTTAYATFDTRFVVANWTPTALNGAIGGAMRSTTDLATIAFTPSGNVTTFELWYAISSSQGSFNYNVDGGSNTLINASNATPSLGKITIAAGAAGAHTLNIIKSGTTAVNILGVLAYNTSLTTGFNDEVQIIQAGHSGATSATYSLSTNPWDGINEITSLAPDLTYLQLSINDWVSSTPIATYKANIQLLIDACKLSGDVILSTDCPTETGTASTALQMQYVQAIKELAATNNLLVYDLYSRLISYSEANADGFMVDTLHGNSFYYGDSSRGLFNLIATV